MVQFSSVALAMFFHETKMRDAKDNKIFTLFLFILWNSSIIIIIRVQLDIYSILNETIVLTHETWKWKYLCSSIRFFNQIDLWYWVKFAVIIPMKSISMRSLGRVSRCLPLPLFLSLIQLEEEEEKWWNRISAKDRTRFHSKVDGIRPQKEFMDNGNGGCSELYTSRYRWLDFPI